MDRVRILIFIISQLIGLIAFAFSLVAYHKKDKNSILSNMVVSNILNLVHYLLLGALSGSVTKIIAIFRDLFIIFKDKYKIRGNIFLLIFIGIYVIACIWMYTDIYSIFPLVAAIIYLVQSWNGNEKTVKMTALLCYFLWLFYNIVVFSIAGIISNVISIISTGIAVWKNGI